MKTRAITGFFFVLIMLASVSLGSHVFSVFYLLLAIACLVEFYGMFKPSDPAGSSGISGFHPDHRLGSVLGFLSLSLPMLIVQGILPARLIALLLLVVPLLLLVHLFRKDSHPFGRIAGTLLGYAYVLLPFYCFYQLAFVQGSFNGLLPLGFLLILWANDTGAYLIGRAFGRHKLFERISPKKTWEGFVGGLLSSLFVGLILFRQTEEVLALWQWLVLAGLISVIGTLGDLVESMLKRSLKVKDSGNLLPGHGGLLDRFDGLLLAAPFIYLFLLLINN